MKEALSEERQKAPTRFSLKDLLLRRSSAEVSQTQPISSQVTDSEMPGLEIPESQNAILPSNLKAGRSAPLTPEISKERQGDEHASPAGKALGLFDSIRKFFTFKDVAASVENSVPIPMTGDGYLQIKTDPSVLVAQSESGNAAPVASLNAASPVEARAKPEPATLPSLVERVRQAVEAQPPPQPRHIAFQLTPQSLGSVQVDMKWSSQGWNVQWSGTHIEVRDWLVQQLPSIQQQNQSQGITWQTPTLQTSSWDFNQQQQQERFQGRESEILLPEDDPAMEEEISRRKKEFWA
jgi:hypothetical protein